MEDGNPAKPLKTPGNEVSNIKTYADKDKRFLLQPRLRDASPDGDGIILYAVDTQHDDAKVVIKCYAKEQLRDNTVKALTELRDDRFVATFADPEDRASCVFSCPDLKPSAPHAVVLQRGDSSLKDALCQYESLDINDTRMVLEKLLQAVTYLHSAGWVHCALQTDNVLEFKNMTYKIIDFDLACKEGETLKDVPPEVCPPDIAALLAKGQAAQASWAIDAWSLGCLFFHLLMGAPLIHFLVPGSCEMPRDELLASIAGLQQGAVERVIEPIVANTPKVNYKNAWSLMAKMLKVNPSQRIKPDAALQHVFFQGGIADDLPGDGRVTPQLEMKLGELGNQMEDVRKLIAKATNLISDIADKECPNTFVILPDGPDGKGGPPTVEEVQSWASSLIAWFKEPPSLEEISKKLATKHLRLYLVCELSGERQGTGYTITEPSELVGKLLPAMQMGFKLLKLANGAAQVVRCFWPVPSIPDNVMEKAKTVIEALDQKSSVEDFACVQDSLGVSQPDHKTQLVGGSIREFHSFLQKVDPTNVWAGLQRFVTQDGHVLWVSAKAAAGALRKNPGAMTSGKLAGRVDSTDGLEEGRPDVSVRPAKTDDERALLEAAFSGNVSVVQQLLSKGTVNPNATNKVGFTALSVAAEKGYVDVMQVLLEHHALMSAMQGEGTTPLHIACANGQKAAVELLIRQGADVTMKSKNGATALHVAAREGYLELVQLLLDKTDDIAAVDNDGNTPLLLAAQRDHLEVVQLLLSRHEAGVRTANKSGSTPLHLASHRGYMQVVQLLLDNKAEVARVNKHGSTPLHLASARGHADVAQLLISKKAPVDVKDKDQWTPLHDAAAWSHADVVAVLLQEKDVDIEALERDDRTPLLVACIDCLVDVIKVLLDKGADMAAKDKDDLTAVHIASRKGTKEGLELLLQQPKASVQAKDKMGRTPLHLACRSDNLPAVDVLCSHGADIAATDLNGNTPLHLASQEGCEDVVKFLLTKNADIAAKDKEGNTPLHLACAAGRKDVVALLLQKQADVKAARSKDGATPVHLASGFGDKELVNLLVKAGASLEAKDANGSTPLHIASANGKKDMAEYLVRRRPEDLAASDKHGCVPLHLASKQGHKEVVELLVKTGAEINSKDAKYGNSPLHWACARGHHNVAQLLLEKKAAVNSTNKVGSTPLHDAAACGFKELVQLLLKHGADLTIRDQRHKTPARLAKESKQTEVYKLLKEAEAVGDKVPFGEVFTRIGKGFTWIMRHLTAS